MNQTLKIYRQASRFPGGRMLFAKALTFRAPYFATIRPRVVDLRAGMCQVKIKDRRTVRNHLGTVNAGALCTLSELTGGLAVDASIPRGLRWIPKKMEVAYLKKAKGGLIGACRIDPETLVPGEVGVDVEITDASSETVLRARILFYISRRPAFQK